MVKFSRYVGAKDKFVDEFNRMAARAGCSTYVEPFFGSGAIFFNLSMSFDRYVINDLNPDLINALNAFKHGEYTQYLTLMDDAFSTFGDVKKNKQSYYDFRNWFNREHWRKGTVEEGFYFHMLMNACINSLVRVGPNGMNASYGNRFLTMDESTFNAVKARLALTEITSRDYMEVLAEHDGSDTLFFLDPPYAARPTVGYGKTFGMPELANFLHAIDGLQGKVVYTDIMTDLHASLPGRWNVIDLGQMANVSPARKSESVGMEVVYYNFEFKQEAAKMSGIQEPLF